MKSEVDANVSRTHRGYLTCQEANGSLLRWQERARCGMSSGGGQAEPQSKE